MVEKIVVKNIWYTQKQFSVNIVAFKNLIDIGSVAIELLRKPRNASPLPQHLIFYYFADVLHKKREPLSAYLKRKALENHWYK